MADEGRGPKLVQAGFATAAENAGFIEGTLKIAFSGADVTYKVTTPFRFIDATVHATATASSGTVTVKRNTTAVTDAIVCATNHALTRAGTVDDAQIDFQVGDDLFIDTNNTPSGVIYLRVGRI